MERESLYRRLYDSGSFSGRICPKLALAEIGNWYWIGTAQCERRLEEIEKDGKRFSRYDLVWVPSAQHVKIEGFRVHDFDNKLHFDVRSTEERYASGKMQWQVTAEKLFQSEDEAVTACAYEIVQQGNYILDSAALSG